MNRKFLSMVLSAKLLISLIPKCLSHLPLKKTCQVAHKPDKFGLEVMIVNQKNYF